MASNRNQLGGNQRLRHTHHAPPGGDKGLPLPEFVSDRQKNEFKVTLFLHHLLTEEDYAWLKALASDTLSADEAKALI